MAREIIKIARGTKFADWCREDTGDKKENEHRRMMLDVFTEQNPNFNAEEIAACSHDRFNFKCRTCGYEWQAKLYNVTQLGSGCPACNKTNTSLGEQFVYRLFKKNFPETKLHYMLKKADGISIRDGICMYEYDIFIPELKLLVEYGAERLHLQSNVIALDRKKQYTADFHSLKLLTIIEKQTYDKTTLNCDIEINCHQNPNCFKELAQQIKAYIFENYGIEIDTGLTPEERLECYLGKFEGNPEQIRQAVNLFAKGKGKWFVHSRLNMDEKEVERIYRSFAMLAMIHINSRK